jgi:signal transduction histidine kinase
MGGSGRRRIRTAACGLPTCVSCSFSSDSALISRPVRGRSLLLFIVLALVAAAARPLAAAERGQTLSSHLPTLTTIGAIRALSQDEGARGYPVRVRGVVTHVDEGADVSVIIHDGRVGQFVVEPPKKATGALAAWRELRRGDLVEIEGRTVRGGFAPNLEPDVVRRLGQSALPQPKTIAFGSMLSGRHDCDYVEITGVVQRAWRPTDPKIHTLFMDVAVEEGVVRAYYWDFDDADAERFIDARVTLRGNIGSLFGRTEQLRGVSLFAGRARDIAVLEPPPDSFTLVTRTARSIYNYSAAGEVNRRIRIRGVVTSYIAGQPVEINDFTSTAKFRHIRNVLYVADATGGARIETEQAQRVEPGTVVDIAGFPAVTPGKPILTNAVFKVAGTAPQPPATVVTDANVLTPDYDASLVKMRANFLSVLRTPLERIMVLQIGESVFPASLEAGPAAEALETLRPGTVVDITGVYAYQWGPSPSFRLFLRSAGDVKVIAAAQWWTMRHTAVMIAILTLGACATAVWMRTAAKRRRQQYQAVLTERSRVARELHDTLEQGLAGIALQLEAVGGSLAASPDRAQQSLDVARRMLQYSQEEARRSVMDLRAQALESRDLAGALTELTEERARSAGVHARVTVEGGPRYLDGFHEHHLLRIGLEALTNALKHSGATHIDVVLRFDPEHVELTVKDDGCGISHAADDVPAGHFGLLGIRERVGKLGGVLQLRGAPGEGTQLTVRIPTPQKQAGAAPAAGALGASWRTS